MELTKEQIETIENAFDCDISEVSNFVIASFVLQNSDVFPDFIHNIGRYFNEDDISISYAEINDINCDEAKVTDYIIKANSKDIAVTKYKEYLETQFKIMQAIMDINSTFYNAIEDNFILKAEAHVVSFDTKFNFIITKKDKTINIWPITHIGIEF